MAKEMTLTPAGMAVVAIALAASEACAASDSVQPPGTTVRYAGGTSSPSSVSVPTSRGEFSLIIYPPALPAGKDDPADEKPLVLVISGEGGWRRFDTLLSGFLTGAGYWVGGMDTRKYFQAPQDDRRLLGADVRAYADALASAAGRASDAPLVLAGYSFGADLSPWIAGAGGWGDRIQGIVMIGPDATGSLQFRLSELLGFESESHTFLVADAIRSAAGIPMVFVHGDADGHSSAPELWKEAPEPKRLLRVEGSGHHFTGHEDSLREQLIEGLRWIVGATDR